MKTKDEFKDIVEVNSKETESQAEFFIEWMERDQVDDTRRGAMYCFKSCSVNAN